MCSGTFLNDRTRYHTNTVAMIIDITKNYEKILDLPDTPEADLPTFRITRLAEDIAKALYLKLLVGLIPRTLGHNLHLLHAPTGSRPEEARCLQTFRLTLMTSRLLNRCLIKTLPR